MSTGKINVLKNEVIKSFHDEFKSDPTICIFAPGRVNLIGEHLDYNDGFVFPMAIQLGTIIVGKQIDGTKCTIKTLSEDVDKPTHIDIDLTKVVKPVDSPKWSNYVTGVLALYLDKIKPKQKHAFQLCIGNNVPVGGGLSSSASIEVAMCTFLECLYQQELDKLEKALLCQKAEQTFANVPCGIMDQYVACKGEKDHAVLIDCRTNTSKLIPMKDQDVAILVSNTNVKHELGVGTFGERVQQCEEAAKILGKKRLRDVESLDELKKLHGKMPDVSYRRAYHVITEIDRTKKGAEALADNNYELFGKYMLESHKSLKDDYEVSCEELDQFVEILKDIDGVYGTRMTGAGFGGCTVTLVKKSSVQKCVDAIKKEYEGKPTFYEFYPSDGARILSLNDETK